MPGFTKRLATSLSERLASTWVLLSDTTNFLSRTSVFGHYESQLRDMRSRLASSKDDTQVVRAIRKELTELREALRFQGYDLSLGTLELSVKGFRNDAAVVEGFRRIVLFIGDRVVYYLAGEDNHRELFDALDAQVSARNLSGITQRHCLWYRWSNGLLMISGADSETAEDFERLKTWCELPEHRLALLGRLKKLR